MAAAGAAAAVVAAALLMVWRESLSVRLVTAAAMYLSLHPAAVEVKEAPEALPLPEAGRVESPDHKAKPAT